MSNAIEETPLLAAAGEHDPYARFSKPWKRAILAFVSWAGLVPRTSQNPSSVSC